MKKIEKFMLPEHTNNLYEKEAISSISLTKEVADKINELVDMINQLSQVDLEWKQVQEGTIRKGVLFMKDNLVNSLNDLMNLLLENGYVDDRIKKETSLLSTRVENLLGKVTDGTTTMDAEIIDARVGEDNGKYANLGTAIRTQFSKTLRYIQTTLTNANDMVEPGYYFKSGGDNWENVPETAKSTACTIVTFAVPGAPFRVMQYCIDFNGECYIRGKKNATEFYDWMKLATDKELSKEINYNKMKHKPTNIGEPWNADTITESGFYFFGDAHTTTNMPGKIGVLIVYKGELSHQLYQMWMDYYGGLYIRNYLYNVGFTDWVKILSVGDIPATTGGGTSKQYKVAKSTDNLFYIYKHGSNGYIRYGYKHDVNANTNTDTYRLETVDHVGEDMSPINTISDSGADLEGVVLLDGDSDHLGGVHGDETATEYYIFIDGKQYTMETIPDMECNEIRIVVVSNITHMDSNNVCMRKIKHTTFDRDGVHVNCEWEALEELNINSIRSCMFSIEKENITHYYDSNVNRKPTPVPAVSGSNSTLSSDPNITDIIYVGNVSAHHWCGDRGGDNSGYSTIIADYGHRMKSYFNCYDNHTAQTGEKMNAVNHFNVEC